MKRKASTDMDLSTLQVTFCAGNRHLLPKYSDIRVAINTNRAPENNPLFPDNEQVFKEMVTSAAIPLELVCFVTTLDADD